MKWERGDKATVYHSFISFSLTYTHVKVHPLFHPLFHSRSLSSPPLRHSFEFTSEITVRFSKHFVSFSIFSFSSLVRSDFFFFLSHRKNLFASICRGRPLDIITSTGGVEVIKWLNKLAGNRVTGLKWRGEREEGGEEI